MTVSPERSGTVRLKKALVCLDSANRDSLSSPVMAERERKGKKVAISFFVCLNKALA